MNWKKTLSSVLAYATCLFVFFMFRYSKDVLRPDSGVLLENVFQAFSLSLCIVGGQQLDRLKRERVSAALIFFFIPLSLALSFVLIVAGKFSQVWSCAFFILFTIPFPWAVYLNRKQSKSTPQPTSANVP
ncbi:MAG: hypothetical protein WBQ94_29540 [Terracidiphilus sp.]